VTDSQGATDGRFPQVGDIVLYGKSWDGNGSVYEVPAIVLEVRSPGDPASRVGLKTFEMSHDMDARHDVTHTVQPRQGCWRWRPGR